MQAQLGGIPLERIRMAPPPGMATDEDALRIQDAEGRTCEVLDGVLVEKAMGFFEARVATVLAFILEGFLQEHDLGIAVGPDGLVRLTTTRTRAPDVAVIRWEKFPQRQLPAAPVPNLAPDLTVEVLSKGNTRKEIETKLDDYFTAGVKASWIIDPARKTAKLYRSRTDVTEIDDRGILQASVLPGFALVLGDLLERAGQREAK
ncbi:MAG TPA: Uma2 family endonuclease [Lacipirellula sp.]